jgi:acetoacetyl-CoA synthetase
VEKFCLLHLPGSPLVGDILWQPSEQRVTQARVTRFRNTLNDDLGLHLDNYAGLYSWSIDNPEDFWRSVWDQCGVVGQGPGQVILDQGEKMPGASWFPEAELNYAENLLQGDDAQQALVFRSEDGSSQSFDYAALRLAVSQTAEALRASGVVPGDRVAGFLPNIPETVVAMLAAATVGAVWSSCSPDFGVSGVLDRFGQVLPKVLFTADGYLYGGKRHDSLDTAAMLQREISSIEKVVVISYVPLSDGPTDFPQGAGFTPWETFLATQSHAPSTPQYHRLPFAHPLFIMFSSGTTGLPKCMVHSAGGTLLQHLKEHQLHCDVNPGDRIFYFTTCGWMMWNWLVSALASKATVMLFDGHPLLPETTLWDYAEQEKFTILGTSARWIAACDKAGLKPAGTHDLHHLRAVLSTGSPLAPDSFDYIYNHVKKDVQLSSISGGTDIISCFALGSPVLPVRRGELQCRGLGMQVEVWDDSGCSLTSGKGELVCAAPSPSMPSGFWNDDQGTRYHQAYFARFANIWCHGDFAELTASGGMIIHGRSDTVLNPGGVRIGTAEIYRVVDAFAAVAESLVVGWQCADDVKVVLFVKMGPGKVLTEGLQRQLKRKIRKENSPRHVPWIIIGAPDIPRTISGKKVEIAVRNILNGGVVDNEDALANPEALDFFRFLVSPDGPLAKG